tara:strand:+ start:644 stop:1471 length:828 start_codon:yes stop_codon:yes gene_type:complete
MTISAKEVQELRKMSGAGMMECKLALSEAGGNIEQAFKLLREKGIAKAEKKSTRDANEGLVGIKVHDNFASIIEVNSETDFVSRNSEFHNLVNSILDISISTKSEFNASNDQALELINAAVGKIGENIVLKRSAFLEGNIYSYIHNSVSDGLGKIGVIINIDNFSKGVDQIGKNLCMHIAALNPKSISRDDLDEQLVEAEKDIIKQQLKDTGKPDNIVEKMLDGKINKFYEDTTLLGQKFVLDPTINVGDYLNKSSKELAIKLKVNEFIRFEIGS